MSLYTKESQALLNLMADLKLEGLTQYVLPPKIVLCGDRFSDRISVLEMITGMDFPVEENLSPRFRIEFVFRQAPVKSIKAFIRTKVNREKLESLFDKRDNCRNFSLSKAVRNSARLMDLSEGEGFVDDSLRFQISGPNLPNLTIVDFPGSIQLAGSNPTNEEPDGKGSIIKDELDDPHRIVLAISVTNSQFTPQSIIPLIQLVDRDGQRTVDLMTRPDILEYDPGAEKSYYRFVRNAVIDLGLGHMLKDREMMESRKTNQPESHQGKLHAFGTAGVAKLNIAQLNKNIEVLSEYCPQQENPIGDSECCF